MRLPLAQLVFGHGGDKRKQFDKDFFAESTAARMKVTIQRGGKLFVRLASKIEPNEVFHSLRGVDIAQWLVKVVEQRSGIVL